MRPIVDTPTEAAARGHWYDLGLWLAIRGWISGMVDPHRSGFYERLTALGPRVDHFDGRVWRRVPYPNPIMFVPGVICANQSELHWRELAKVHR